MNVYFSVTALLSLFFTGAVFSVETGELEQPNPSDYRWLHSTNLGETWSGITAQSFDPTNVKSLFAKEGAVFLGTWDGFLYQSCQPEKGNWVLEGIGGMNSNQPVTGIFSGHSGTYVCIYGVGLFRKSSDSGTWKHLSKNLEGPVINDLIELQDGMLLVSGPEGIYKSTDDGANWKSVFNKGFVKDIAFDDNAFVASGPEGIVRSMDKGETWQLVLADNMSEYNFSVLSGHLVAMPQLSFRTKEMEVKQKYEVLISEDGGQSWNVREDISMDQPINELIQINDYLLYSNQSGISRSIDGGKNWELVYAIPDSIKMMHYRVVVAGQNIYAALVNDGC